MTFEDEKKIKEQENEKERIDEKGISSGNAMRSGLMRDGLEGN